VTEIRCTYDPESRGVIPRTGARFAAPSIGSRRRTPKTAEVRIYDHLFAEEEPGKERDWLEDLNPDSLDVRSTCYLEPALQEAETGIGRAVRAAGLFLHRPGLPPRWAGLQPHGRFARQLGKGERQIGLTWAINSRYSAKVDHQEEP